MRILVAGKEALTKDQEREWAPDNGGRIRHMIPDEHGPWHYAFTMSISESGRRKNVAYFCWKCDRGGLL